MSNSTNRANEIEIQEISDIMSTEAGRKFVSRILDMTNYFGDTFDHDTIKHARNAGRRSVGIDLFAELQNAAPDKLMILLRERING